MGAWFTPMDHSLRNNFGRNRFFSYVMWVEWISMQDWCPVCAKHTIGSKIIWTHLIVLLGDMDQEEAHFDPFGES
jgi:hypothetical protein